jgi:7,8-dihydropterin-6-yl-methyl-4-(beta-D-ribofuranosyl)aminobenzene 5'-phosphate synthase
MDRILLPPVDSVEITTVMDNVTDLTSPGSDSVVRRAFGSLPRVTSHVLNGPSWDIFRGEHGFSAMVTVHYDGLSSSLLFDAGLTPTGVIDNLDRLEVDPAGFEAIVLSHGHFDHTGGLAGIIDRLGTADLPVLIHPEFWNRRRISVPNADPIELPTTSRSALEGAGFDIIEDRSPSFLFNCRVLITGEVDRTTGYEPGMLGQQALRHNAWVPEPETLDDQALVINVKDKGLVVMSGCGHAGVVNTARYAQKLTGITNVHAIVGGFHLGPKAFHSIIDQTVDDLLALDPDVIVPAHCTGFKAQVAFANHLPNAFLPNSVGTTFKL